MNDAVNGCIMLQNNRLSDRHFLYYYTIDIINSHKWAAHHKWLVLCYVNTFPHLIVLAGTCGILWLYVLRIVWMIWACVVLMLQSTMQTVEAELQQVRESNSHQRKRVIEMMMSLMKDLADIGTAIGSEFKVWLVLRRYPAVIIDRTLQVFGNNLELISS